MPRSRFVGLLSCVLLISFSTAFGQQPSATSSIPNSATAQIVLIRDPQAVSVLAAAVAALGRTPPTDSTASGTVVVSLGAKTESGTVSVLTRGLNQTLEEINLAGSVRKTIVSGWDVAGDDGSGQKFLPGIVSHAVYFPLPFLAGALGNPDFSFQYLGLESLSGTSAHHIRMWTTFASKASLRKLSKQSTRDVWIDAASNLPIRMSFVQQPTTIASQIRFDLDLSAYRSIGGIMYPTVIQKSLNGTEWMTISIGSINLNSGLSDTTFAITCTN